jgi:hypothetical protein
MNDNQLNYQTMTGTTIGFMNGTAAKLVWGGNGKVTSKLAEIVATKGRIESLAVLQTASTTGSTINKNNAWDVAGKQAEHVCNALKAYASDAKDTVLWGQVNFTWSDFGRGDIDECIARMQLVHDKAVLVPIASFKDFNLVADDITTLQTDIDALKLAAPGYRILQSTKKTVTAQLVAEFKTLGVQMKSLDEIVDTFKKVNAGFVSSYHTARKIIHLGKTQKTAQLHLQPHQFEDCFGKGFTVGDWFTVRNHSPLATVKVFLTDTPNVLPTDNGVEIAPDEELKLEVAKDFGGVFGHYLLVWNKADLDDAEVTILLAHGKSDSSAPTVGKKSS